MRAGTSRAFRGAVKAEPSARKERPSADAKAGKRVGAKSVRRAFKEARAVRAARGTALKVTGATHRGHGRKQAAGSLARTQRRMLTLKAGALPASINPAPAQRAASGVRRAVSRLPEMARPGLAGTGMSRPEASAGRIRASPRGSHSSPARAASARQAGAQATGRNGRAETESRSDPARAASARQAGAQVTGRNGRAATESRSDPARVASVRQAGAQATGRKGRSGKPFNPARAASARQAGAQATGRNGGRSRKAVQIPRGRRAWPWPERSRRTARAGRQRSAVQERWQGAAQRSWQWTGQRPWRAPQAADWPSAG